MQELFRDEGLTILKLVPNPDTGKTERKQPPSEIIPMPADYILETEDSPPGPSTQ